MENKGENVEFAEIKVNTDPKEGPLDGARAETMAVRTVFLEDGEIEQDKQQVASITATMLHGVVSIRVGDTMFTVRLDEMYGVIAASVDAFKKIYAKKKDLN